MCWRQSLLVYVVISGSWLVRSQLLQCADDPTFEPEEGIMEELQFSWLGILQYIHVKNGTPHYFRAPRVILIARQFVLATAKDAAQVPEEYVLGNVIFGDYERDEKECGLTPEDYYKGTPCDPAIVIVPLVGKIHVLDLSGDSFRQDVLLHPEYKHYGAENSVALLKMVTPIKSEYMVPVCLPFRDYLTNRVYSTNYTLWHVDFASSVPRDFFDEEKEVTQLNMLPQALCFLYDESENITTEVAKERVMCTTDCDFHSGAPTVLHEHTGHWTAVSIAEGSAPCPDPLRSVRPPRPPRHIKLYPYVPWIITALTGKTFKSFTSNDPFGYTLPRQDTEVNISASWVGHWWLAGMKCYYRGLTASKYFRFYHEIFSIKPGGATRFTYFLQKAIVQSMCVQKKGVDGKKATTSATSSAPSSLSSIMGVPFMQLSWQLWQMVEHNMEAFLHINGAKGTIIICIKVRTTYKTPNPKAWSLETSEVMLRIPVGELHETYKFEVEAWAAEDEDMKLDDMKKDETLESVSSSDDD